MMRLTEAVRNSIISNAVKAVFTERKTALAEQSNDIAEMLYKQLYPQDIVDKMNKLPDEFFSQKSSVTALVDGTKFAFNLKSSRKVSALDNDYQKPKVEVVDIVTKNVIRGHITAKDKLESDRNNFKSELKRFLAGISTDKKLKEVWPEGEVYYAFIFEFKPLTNLPAIQSDVINGLIANMKKL